MSALIGLGASHVEAGPLVCTLPDVLELVHQGGLGMARLQPAAGDQSAQGFVAAHSRRSRLQAAFKGVVQQLITLPPTPPSGVWVGERQKLMVRTTLTDMQCHLHCELRHQADPGSRPR